MPPAALLLLLPQIAAFPTYVEDFQDSAPDCVPHKQKVKFL